MIATRSVQLMRSPVPLRARLRVSQKASANCADHLGIEAAALIGTRLIDHLPSDALHTLRGKVQIMPPR